MGADPLAGARRPGDLHPFRLPGLPQTEQEPPVGLSHETASARENSGLDTQRSLHPDLGAESILAALRPLQLDADEALVLAHVVPEQEMAFALDGGEKDVQVAVVVPGRRERPSGPSEMESMPETPEMSWNRLPSRFRKRASRSNPLKDSPSSKSRAMWFFW